MWHESTGGFRPTLAYNKRVSALLDRIDCLPMGVSTACVRRECLSELVAGCRWVGGLGWEVRSGTLSRGWREETECQHMSVCAFVSCLRI